MVLKYDLNIVDKQYVLVFFSFSLSMTASTWPVNPAQTYTEKHPSERTLTPKNLQQKRSFILVKFLLIQVSHLP